MSLGRASLAEAVGWSPVAVLDRRDSTGTPSGARERQVGAACPCGFVAAPALRKVSSAEWDSLLKGEKVWVRDRSAFRAPSVLWSR